MTNNSQDPAVNTAPNSALVQVRNLRKNYGPVEAVRDVSFDVELGQVVAIIGPSGCGKSTTLRCLNLLEEPTAGTFRIGDHARSAALEHRHARVRGPEVNADDFAHTVYSAL